MNHAASFIPEPRYIALIQRRRRTMWIAINAAGLLLGAAGTLAARAVFLGDASVSSSAVAAANERLESIVAEQTAMATELQSVEARLLAHADATEHPDWSILLGYISRIGGGSIGLDGFVLEPGDADGVYLVGLTGVAPNQNAVTRFLLGLERSGVFSATNLMRSGRTQAGTFSFAIGCRIGTPPPEPAGDEEEEGS